MISLIKLIPTLAILFTISVKADVIDPNTCPTSFPPIDPDSEGTCNTTEVSGWTASTTQIKNINCPPEIPSAAQMYQYVEDHFPPNENSAEITIVKGIEFEGENKELLKHFEDLITKRTFIFDEVSPDDRQDDIQEKYKINPSCKKIKCAIEKMFGQQAARTLYLKTRYGLNVSNHAWELSSRPTNSEMNDLFRAALTFPEHLLPIDGNKRYTRFRRNAGAIFGEGVLANATISFFDYWETFPNEHRQYAAYHELSHYMASELDLDENEEWLSLSGWVEFGDEWEPQFPSTFPSRYGATNPHEDFAEAMSAYRYNPEILLEMSPAKYDYLRDNVYMGIEYRETEFCNRKPPTILRALNNLPQGTPTESDMRSILNMCSQETAQHMLGLNQNSESYQNCLRRASRRHELSISIKSSNPNNPILQRTVNTVPMSDFESEINSITPRVNINELLKFAKQELIDTLMEEIRSKQEGWGFMDDNLKEDACRSSILGVRIHSFNDKDSEDEQRLHMQIFRNSYEDKNHKFNDFVTYCNEVGINNLTEENVISFFDYFDSITPEYRKLTLSTIEILTRERAELIENYNNLPAWQKVGSYPQHARDLERYDTRLANMHLRLQGLY